MAINRQWVSGVPSEWHKPAAPKGFVFDWAAVKGGFTVKVTSEATGNIESREFYGMADMARAELRSRLDGVVNGIDRPRFTGRA